MPAERRTIADILEAIAVEASASGDHPILELVEEACEVLGLDEGGRRPKEGD